MKVAVAHAGRCSSCSAEPFAGLRLHAHWSKRKLGPRHLPLPGLYTVLCDACHGQLTAKASNARSRPIGRGLGPHDPDTPTAAKAARGPLREAVNVGKRGSIAMGANALGNGPG